jgi:hypothetical protein
MNLFFGKSIPFQMSTLGGAAFAPNVVPVVKLVKEGGPPIDPWGAVENVGFGCYRIAANDHDTDTPGSLVLIATAPGCDPWFCHFCVLPKADPRDMRKTEVYLDKLTEQADEIITQNTRMILQNDQQYARLK